MLRALVVAFFITAIPLASLAEETTGGDCAADLSPDSKLIYDESRAVLTRDANLDKIVEEKTRGLVFDGKISMWSAREAAESAYSCLEMQQG